MNVIGFLISNGCGAGASTETLAKKLLAHTLTATNYWSSTENSTNNAWNVNFSNGNINNNNKYNGNAVRAVAALDEETKIGWLIAYHDCCANKKSSYEWKKAFAKLSPRFWEVCYMKNADTLACVKIKKQFRLKEYLYNEEVKDYDLVLRNRKTRRAHKQNKARAAGTHD